MIRCSEVVLPGHPDKACDAVADAIINTALHIDPHAFGQIEVAVWGYEMWLTGELVTSEPLPKALENMAQETMLSLGYTRQNAYDANRMQVRSSVIVSIDDPRDYSHRVNDQCIVIGWAGYDKRVEFMPPEHFIARKFVQAIWSAIQTGSMAGQGPDGKILIRLCEQPDGWALQHVLASIQHQDSTSLFDHVGTVSQVLASEYRRLQAYDKRWVRPWEEVTLLINPNGPFVRGGPQADNGQTGRKLVMDHYGPRIPIGGGALSGKDPRHIDRYAARIAREAALLAVSTGANECQVTLNYAPNRTAPVDVCYEMNGDGTMLPAEAFRHRGDSSRTDLWLPGKTT